MILVNLYYMLRKFNKACMYFSIVFCFNTKKFDHAYSLKRDQKRFCLLGFSIRALEQNIIDIQSTIIKQSNVATHVPFQMIRFFNLQNVLALFVQCVSLSIYLSSISILFYNLLETLRNCILHQNQRLSKRELLLSLSVTYVHKKCLHYINTFVREI